MVTQRVLTPCDVWAWVCADCCPDTAVPEMDALKARANDVATAVRAAGAEFMLLPTTSQLVVVLATLVAIIVIKAVVQRLFKNPKVRTVGGSVNIRLQPRTPHTHAHTRTHKPKFHSGHAYTQRCSCCIIPVVQHWHQPLFMSAIALLALGEWMISYLILCDVHCWHLQTPSARSFSVCSHRSFRVLCPLVCDVAHWPLSTESASF